MSPLEPGASPAGDELFRRSFEHSPLGMAIIDSDGVIIEANASLARILGYDAAPELTGLRTAALTHPDDAPKDMTSIRARLDGDPSYSADKRYIRRDGSVCHTHISSTLVHLQGGDDVVVVMQVEDVTSAKLAENELQRLADAAEIGSDAIISLDLDRRIRHWNRGAEHLLGFSGLEVIGVTLDELYDQTHESARTRASGIAAVQGAFAGRRASVHETVRHHRDGTVKNLSVAVAPWRIDGEIVGATATLTDLTDRKRAEQTTARLAAIVDASDDAIIGKTLEGVITSWNPSAERIYGYTAQEAVGEHISMLAAPGNEADFAEILSTVRAGDVVKHLETKRRRKDGAVIEVLITVSPVRDASGEITGAATVARDISELKREERAREQNLRNLAEAQRMAKLGSWTWDSVADEATWSEQMYEIFGRDPAAGPATSDEFFAYVHPEDRERIARGYAETFGNGPGFELTYRIVDEGGTERHLRGLGYQDPSNPGIYVGTVQDVSEQHRAELERIELFESTVRADAANRAKSEFLARMSHELRTPLNSIMGFSQLLELEGLEPRQQKHVELVLKAGRHLLDLINDVLDIARIESGRFAVSPEPVGVVDAVADAVAMVTPLADARGITLDLDTTDLEPDAYVRADSNRLRQVLLNVLSNAIKYNREAGLVHVRAFGAPHGRVRIAITDTGTGIKPDELSKLFKPFERLGAEQTEVEGTGLGLSLSKALLEAMGGTIEVETSQDLGSTFTIELEPAERPATAAADQIDHARLHRLGAAGETRRILYVEDNLANLTLVREILNRYSGVELVSAMQGSLGLELAAQQPPDLILLDLHLPDMTGMDVLKRLKAEEATRDIPVVMLTANPGKSQAARSRRLGASDYLAKPLDVNVFMGVVSQHLAPSVE